MEITQNASRFFRITSLVIIAYGVFIRLFHYFSNRSLYTDEAYLGVNLLTRSFRQLLQPLDANQHAPILFLWIEKLNMTLFGTSEYILRLFPLITGIAALWLFYMLLTKIQLEKAGVLIGLTVFATAFPLIYYSSETKQYSVEVLTTIIAYYLYYQYRHDRSLVRLLPYALSGGLLVWFSYPVIFVLISIAVVHLIVLSLEKRGVVFFTFFVVYAFWGVNFLLNYLLIIHPNSLKAGAIVDVWASEFAPLIPASQTDLKWYALALFKLFDYPLNLNWTFLKPWVAADILLFSFLGLLCTVWGGVFLFKNYREKFFILLLPVFITLIASGLHRYPFSERFLLFLVPNFVIMIGFGADRLYTYLVRRSSYLAVAIGCLLVLPPVIISCKDLIYEEQFGDWKRREMKQAIAYLTRHKQPGEHIFLNPVGYAFLYYNQIYDLNWPHQIIETEANSLTAEQLRNQIKATTANQTFWVVIAGNLQGGSPDNDKAAFLRLFDAGFKKRQHYSAKGIYAAQYSTN